MNGQIATLRIAELPCVKACDTVRLKVSPPVCPFVIEFRESQLQSHEPRMAAADCATPIDFSDEATEPVDRARDRDRSLPE